MILHADDTPRAVAPSARFPAAHPAPAGEALAALLLSREDVAALLGITRGRLESYLYGTRRMPDDMRRRLAVALAGHAAELHRLSAELLAADSPDGSREPNAARG